MSAYTPGPWRAIVRPFGRGHTVEVWCPRGLVAKQEPRDAKRDAVHVCGGWPIPAPHRYPNALLMAAAPEMYELICEIAHDGYSAVHLGCDANPCVHCRAAKLMCKAEGR